MTPQRVILGAWLAMIGLATVRRVTDPTNAGLPAPATYLGIGVLFTLLYGLGTAAPALAATLAVGVDLGAALAPYLKGGPSPIQQLALYLDGLAGAPAPSVPSAPPIPSSQR